MNEYDEYLEFAKNIANYAGKVTDLFGNEQRYDQSIKGAIVSNRKVHNEIVNIIKENNA